MRSSIRIMAVIAIFFVLIFASGCFLTITQNLKDGSKLLVSAYDSLSKDYDVLVKSIDTCILEPTEGNIKKYKKFEKKFKGGFEAVGIAIKAEDDVIQSLKTK